MWQSVMQFNYFAKMIDHGTTIWEKFYIFSVSSFSWRFFTWRISFICLNFQNRLGRGELLRPSGADSVAGPSVVCVAWFPLADACTLGGSTCRSASTSVVVSVVCTADQTCPSWDQWVEEWEEVLPREQTVAHNACSFQEEEYFLHWRNIQNSHCRSVSYSNENILNL